MEESWWNGFDAKTWSYSRAGKLGEMGANDFQSDFFYMTLGIFFCFMFLPKRRAEQTVDNLDIV